VTKRDDPLERQLRGLRPGPLRPGLRSETLAAASPRLRRRVTRLDRFAAARGAGWALAACLALLVFGDLTWTRFTHPSRDTQPQAARRAEALAAELELTCDARRWLEQRLAQSKAPAKDRSATARDLF